MAKRKKRTPEALANELTTDLRLRKAFSLRLRGWSFEDIGGELGITESAVAHLINRRLQSLRANCVETAEDVRMFEAERLDRWMNGLWDRAVGGDVAAVAAMLRLQERRAKLLGLDLQGVAPSDKSSGETVSIMCVPYAGAVTSTGGGDGGEGDG